MLNVGGYQCSNCGFYSRTGLHVDHILPRRDRPDLELDIRNLRILCNKCHSSAGTSGHGGGSEINKKHNASIGSDGFADDTWR